MGRSTYTDDALREAVAASRSWRAVMRALGLKGTSSQGLRSVRDHADRLELRYAHFTGQRRWSNDELATAVARSDSWSQVARTLGLSGASSQTALKGHAARLGIDTSHMSRPKEPPAGGFMPRPVAEHLARSGEMLAAGWFSLCGFRVSWPMDPCRYDLVVERDGEFLRIQVKTTRSHRGGSWVVGLASNSTAQLVYDPDEIDYFFVIRRGAAVLPAAVLVRRWSEVDLPQCV